MSNYVPKALSKLTRFPIIALPYERRTEALPCELMVDYENGSIYVMDEFGNIKSLSQTININSVYIKNENGDIISLETLINSMARQMLQVEEVSELSIFKIDKEAQFDLKSVVLKNNLVQIYNFDQAQEDSIPIKMNDRVAWVSRDALLAEAGFAISAYGSLNIAELPIFTNRDFISVTISNAKNANGDLVPNANGTYSSTENDYVWVRRISANEIYTVSYDADTKKWSLTDKNSNKMTGTVTPTKETTYEVSLIENKKQLTNILEPIELIVYVPEKTGELMYSKIIWKAMTGNEAPVLRFMTTSDGNIIKSTNIIWEYVEDYQPAPNVNNFYTLETWDNGANWFGRVVRMGKTSYEVDEDYLSMHYYNKSEIDDFTSWDIRL